MNINTVFPDLDPSLSALLRTRLDRFRESLAASGLGFAALGAVSSDLIKVLLFSEFVSDHLCRDPNILADLAASKDLVSSYGPNTHTHRLDQLTRHAEPGRIQGILTRFKLREIIRIAWRDLTGKAGLEETLADLSGLARACIASALDFTHKELCRTHGTPTDGNGHPQQMIILGMGKLGAGELNFSSDIDLIFVYPEDGNTILNDRVCTSNEDFFTRLCKRFIALFKSGNGFHFYRVDTRLRPFGDSGPLVMSADAFENYYAAHGREWERYAMIKARPVAGDFKAGFRLLKSLNAFIFRRYFDYGSFDAFRDMKQRIELQVKSRQLRHNIKLGAGGIREIEFFGQLFQLIRGGVEPDLQAPGILDILNQLELKGLIKASARNDLTAAYHFLRRLENRLQAYQDKQTHDIPGNENQLRIIALSMGHADAAGFHTELSGVLGTVHHHFSQLLVTETEDDRETASQALKQMWININDPQFSAGAIEVAGYEDPERVLSVLRTLAGHPNTKRLTPAGQKKLARLVPKLVKKVGRNASPEDILVRLTDLIIAVERRTTYLSLLIENKKALETLIILAQKSPWIISFLSRHPVLLDELMNPATLYAPPKKDALEKDMASRMAKLPDDDQEYLLEEFNVFRQVNTLRVAAADVSGNYPLMKVSDHLTWIAETILAQVLAIAWNILVAKYGRPAGVEGNGTSQCGFAIVAYGKVGGLEMGYKSDLDLVFLYKGEPGMTLGGDRSVDIIRFYTTLSQRIIHALTLHTPAGTLYGADMRLRPGGQSGMIVSHIAAFEEYMEKEAWTWEHQALIRARPITGDTGIMKRFNAIRTDTLCRERPHGALKKEVADMRERMRSERLKPEPGMFDLKQGRGGIVDIEFLVQYLVLRHGARYPDITVWTDNIRLLEGLSCEGLISGEESGMLQQAYVTLRKAIHRLTLQEKKAGVPETIYKDTAQAVSDMYDRVLGAS